MFRQCAVLCLGFLLSANALAQWGLVNEDSQINYVSVKNSSVAEVNGFHELSGAIDEAGQASVSIDLASVDTGIAIRNTRVTTMLFEAESYPTADINASINPDTIDGMSVGEISHQTVDFQVSLHGVEQTINTEVQVIKLAGDRLQVSSQAPIIISAESFGLVQGLEKLREVAGLSSITTAVPVTFSLMFEFHDH